MASRWPAPRAARGVGPEARTRAVPHSDWTLPLECDKVSSVHEIMDVMLWTAELQRLQEESE